MITLGPNKFAAYANISIIAIEHATHTHTHIETERVQRQRETKREIGRERERLLVAVVAMRGGGGDTFVLSTRWCQCMKQWLRERELSDREIEKYI